MRKYSEDMLSVDYIEILFPKDLVIYTPQEVDSLLKQTKKCVENLELFLNEFGQSVLMQLEGSQAYYRLSGILYRCHKKFLTKLYSELVIRHNLTIIEPSISTSFQNSKLSSEYIYEMETADKDSILLANNKHQLMKINSVLGQKLIIQLNNNYQKYFGIPHLQRIMTIFPDYYLKLEAYQKILVHHNTQLPQNIVYFLGILAAAQFNCPYLMNRLLRSYKESGGISEWLQGHYPEKIQKLLQFNYLLGFCPWKISQQIIAKLVHLWGRQTILHAALVICFYHFQCQICLTLGLIPETNEINKIFKQKISEQHSNNTQNIQKMSQSMIDVLNNQFQEDGRKSGHSQTNDTQEQFGQNIISKYMLEIDNKIKNNHYKIITKKYNNLIIPSSQIILRNEDQYPSIQQWEWGFRKNSFPLLNSYLPQASKQLLSLLDGVMSIELPMTLLLKKSIKYYADYYLGYRHNGFDYKQKMKQMLKLPMRFFIMVSIQYPFLLEKQFMEGFMNSNKKDNKTKSISEILYLSLLIGSTRMEQSIVYLTKCFEDVLQIQC